MKNNDKKIIKFFLNNKTRKNYTKWRNNQELEIQVATKICEKMYKMLGTENLIVWSLLIRVLKFFSQVLEFFLKFQKWWEQWMHQPHY